MWDKIMTFLREKRDIVSYLVFGVLTTLVNYAIYLPLYNFAHLSGGWSNAIAWVGAVIFAFFTNKPFVFRSHDWSGQSRPAGSGKIRGLPAGVRSNGNGPRLVAGGYSWLERQHRQVGRQRVRGHHQLRGQ